MSRGDSNTPGTGDSPRTPQDGYVLLTRFFFVTFSYFNCDPTILNNATKPDFI